MLVAIIGAAALVVATTIGEIIATLRSTNERRRKQYATAYADLVAWTEIPYRIRRRTGDGPDELAALASVVHELQERTACHRAWTALDSKGAGRCYAAALAEIKARTRPEIEAAWNSPPISGPTGMTIGDLDIACTSELEHVATVFAHQFGFRRIHRRSRHELESEARMTGPAGT